MGSKQSAEAPSSKKRSKSFNVKSKRNTSHMVIPKQSTSILTTKTHAIENDYVVLKAIGEGMNGKVHLCQNRVDKKKYALKVK
jgi:serine/threonine protein kinase